MVDKAGTNTAFGTEKDELKDEHFLSFDHSMTKADSWAVISDAYRYKQKELASKMLCDFNSLNSVQATKMRLQKRENSCGTPERTSLN